MRKQVHYKNVQTSRVCADNNNAGFTLTELMVTIVLISVIATFAIPEYGKTVNKSKERGTIMDMLSLHSANQVYEAKTGEYWPGPGMNLAEINAGLSINLKGLDVAYTYTRSAPNQYKAWAAGTAGNNFTVEIREAPIDLAGDNPCCLVAGSCPTLQVCP